MTKEIQYIQRFIVFFDSQLTSHQSLQFPNFEMALNDLMKPTTSGCSSFVLILAAAIPLLLFWGPLRELINDYRIYRQVQKYPHIVVYKNNSRKGYNRISGVAVLIGRLSLKALITLFGFVKYE